MVVGREIEALSSGNGNSSGMSNSGHGTDPAAGASTRLERAGAATEGETTADPGKQSSAREPDGADSAAPVSESSKGNGDLEPGLGKMLAAARESRGMSRAQVAAETRIPAHYLQMIESSDYGLISDQLYLMPFLRRYAAFLKIDGEEVAMRFVREVQRAEGAAAMPRLSEPLAVHDRKRIQWGRIALIISLAAAIVILYIIASRHHREFTFHETAPAGSSAAPAAPNSGPMPGIAAPAQPAPPAGSAPSMLSPTRNSPSGGSGSAAANVNTSQPQPNQPGSPKSSTDDTKDSE